MMNTGDTDPTFIETNIPWVGRCIGDDRQMGYLLIDYMIPQDGLQAHRRSSASSNRYGRFGVREIRDSARRLGHPVAIEMAYKVGGEDFELELERLKSAERRRRHPLGRRRRGRPHPQSRCARWA